MKEIVKKILKKHLSRRTRSLLSFDVLRLKARIKSKRFIDTELRKLHIGCGDRKIEEFLNIDVAGEGELVDLISERLPFSSNHFERIVSQHVIEHIDMVDELEPLLLELFRICKTGAKIYLSTPDMARICRYYVDSQSDKLVEDRKQRWTYRYDEYPDCQIVNHLFHQDGQHKNLFDYELLAHLLKKSGFTNIKEINEETLLSENSTFTPRKDAFMSLYVYCEKP